MFIAPINIIVQPNGIDAPWEIVDGIDLDPMGFYGSKEEAIKEGIVIARRSAFALGLREDGRVRLLHNFRNPALTGLDYLR